MTTTKTRRGAEVQIHAVYLRLAYDVELMQSYFAAIDLAWRSTLALAYYLVYGRLALGVEPRMGDHDMLVPEQRASRLYIQRLSIRSPMEITFAIEGSVVAGTAYAAYLFARVLRSPESIGAWLPRLLAGWHQGMREAEDQKVQRTQRRRQRRDSPPDVSEFRGLIRAGDSLALLDMRAEEVAISGVEDVSDDFAEFESDE